MTSSSSDLHINDLNENVFDEIFDYLSLGERVRCEIVCRRWRSFLLVKRSQRVIKLCFETVSNPTKSICSNRSHRPSSNDVLYFDENAVDTSKIDHLFSKFNNIKSLHLQSKELRLLKRSGVLSTLSKYTDSIEHFEIDLFEGPFTKNDLQLLFNKNWSKSLKHLVIRFQNDNGKMLNRKTIMKFFEIAVDLELFYWKAPYLCTQNLEYTPSKLSSLHLSDTDLDLESLLLLNGNILRQLRLGSVTSEHLDTVTANLLYLSLLCVDSIELDHRSGDGFTVLDGIKKLDRLRVLRFWLDVSGQHVNRIDKEISSIIKGCNRILKVHIENAMITDESLVLVSSYWKDLQSFKLYSRSNWHSSQSANRITNESLAQFLKLKHLHTLALPNHSFSQCLLEQLIDRPKFSYLILREPCLFVEQLFDRMLSKGSIASYNRYKLRINDDHFLNLSNICRPSNFVLNFDLF